MISDEKIKELEDITRMMVEDSKRGLQQFIAMLLYVAHQDAVKLNNYLRDANK